MELAPNNLKYIINPQIYWFILHMFTYYPLFAIKCTELSNTYLFLGQWNICHNRVEFLLTD